MQSDKFTQNIVDTFVEKISTNKDNDNKNIEINNFKLRASDT